MSPPSTRHLSTKAPTRRRSRSLSPPRQSQRIQHSHGRLINTSSTTVPASGSVTCSASPRQRANLTQWMHLWLHQAHRLEESTKATSWSSRLHHKSFRIEYGDEQLKQKQANKVPQLIQTLQKPSATTHRNTLLAKKALRYRRVLSADGFANDDFGDRQFDVSRCNCIRWVCRHHQQPEVNQQCVTTSACPMPVVVKG